MSSSQINPPAAKKRRTGSVSASSRKKPPMHSGRWTPEEEQYVEGMIAEFNAGLLPIAEGTTLRSFLAKMLNCNPKRVSKKYDGNPIYNGKSAYVRAKQPLPPSEACARQENLLELERKFREALQTMQRVESRLQSLTSHLMPAKKSKPEPTPVVDDSWQPSSAVSSLTDDGEQLDGPPKTEETSTCIAKVSQCSQQDSIADSKLAATEAEKAAGHMLLQLNAPRPPAPAAVPPSQPKEDAAIPKLAPADSKERTQQISKDLASALLEAATRSVPQALPNAQPQNNCGELQGLLQKLQGLRQQNPVPQAPSAPSNLQGLLAGQQMLDSPVSRPQGAQQNLQQFMQSLQQKQPNANSMTQQLARAINPCQQQQQQPERQSQQMDTQGVLNSLLQQQTRAPSPQQPQKTNLESFLGSLMQQQNNQVQQQPQVLQQQQTAQVQPGGNQALQNVLQQIANNNNAPQPQQQAVQTIIQGLVNQQQQQAPPQQHQVPQTQQQQGLMNPFLNQQAPQQQQQQQLANAMSSFVNQLQQNIPQQQQQQQAPRNNTNVQAVLQSLAATQNQAPKPPQAPAPAPQDSLQQLLMQLHQQQNQNTNGFQQRM